MKITTIQNILRDYGVIESRIADLTKYCAADLVRICGGKPVHVNISTVNLGRCYNHFHSVVFNYNGTMKPNGMSGPVEPLKIDNIGGMEIAHFHYDIDSGD
jgi:hypothetical protein